MSQFSKLMEWYMIQKAEHSQNRAQLFCEIKKSVKLCLKDFLKKLQFFSGENL